MADGTNVYYKVRDVVRRQGHSESESCRVFKDWHIELRVGVGHVSVWTSQGMVYMTMLDKPVHYLPGAWEEHLARLHQGRPMLKPDADLRTLLRAQAMESEDEEIDGGQEVGERKVIPEALGQDAEASTSLPVSLSNELDTVTQTTDDADSQSPSPDQSESAGDADGPKKDPIVSEYIFRDDVILIDDEDVAE
jgi:hypothetical protein